MSSRCGFRHIAGLAALAAVLSDSGAASAQGLLDFLFRPPVAARPSYTPPPPPRSGVPIFGAPPAVTVPRISGTGRYAAYCVRLCDGRYFPIQGVSAPQAVETCNSLCPASKNQIFSGIDINTAVARDGTRYASLANAFVYRQRTVDNCTCNGADAYGLAKIDLADDPTLRKGDLIVTADGLETFNGSTRAVVRANDGTAHDPDPVSTSGIRGAVDADVRPPPRRVERDTIFSIFGR